MKTVQSALGKALKKNQNCFAHVYTVFTMKRKETVELEHNTRKISLLSSRGVYLPCLAPPPESG